MKSTNAIVLLSLCAVMAFGCIEDSDGNGGGGEGRLMIRVPENHRPDAAACMNVPTEDEVVVDGEPEEWQQNECERHSDCDEGVNGRCVRRPREGSFICAYDQCILDDDCEDGGVCVGCSERSWNSQIREAFATVVTLVLHSMIWKGSGTDEVRRRMPMWLVELNVCRFYSVSHNSFLKAP